MSEVQELLLQVDIMAALPVALLIPAVAAAPAISAIPVQQRPTVSLLQAAAAAAEEADANQLLFTEAPEEMVTSTG